MSTDRPQKGRATPARVKELAEQHRGRNEIARLLGVTTYQVDKAARRAGVSFDKSHTLAATATRQAEAMLERVELAEQFREVARVCLNKVLGADHLAPAELRELMTSAGIAATNDARLGALVSDVVPSDEPGTAAIAEAIALQFQLLEEAGEELLEEGYAERLDAEARALDVDLRAEQPP